MKPTGAARKPHSITRSATATGRPSTGARTPAFGEFNIGAGYRDKKQISYFDFGGFPDYRVADLDVWSFTPRVRIAQPLFGHANTLVAGFDWYRWDYRLRRSNSVENIAQPVNTVSAVQENVAFYLYNTTRVNDARDVDRGRAPRALQDQRHRRL